MIFNKDIFTKLKKPFILMLILIVIFIIINTFVVTFSTNLKYQELSTDGSENINELIINEVMPLNKNAVNIDGKICDWVELYNGNTYDINLKSYGLSDKSNSTKWIFPDVVIKSNDYLVVNLCGYNDNGLVANFKLSNAGDENLFLINSKGKVIDAVNIVKTKSNEVIARDLDGNLFLTETFTPGYINTLEGYDKYFSSLLADSDVRINEVLPKNDGNFKNNYGTYTGYVEIINDGKDTVNLENYCISNNSLAPYKYCFSNINLSSNEILLVNMGDYDSNDELYSNFDLSSKIGTVILTNNDGKIIDKVEYESLANGIALVYENGNFYETTNISPGYSNDANGIEEFNKLKLKNNSGLIINEIMNSNSSYLPQNGNQYYDWIELKNNSNEIVNLSEYNLTTSYNDLKMFNLPDIDLEPDEYYVIIASGDTNLSNNSYIHANFKLSTVESLYLVKNNNIIDSIMIANVPIGYSFGRGISYGTYYFDSPTPGKQNNKGISSVAYVPTFSENSGIYNDIGGINLAINGNGTIYYTLDGSEPTTYSSVYESPIFLNETTVVKAVSYQDKKIISETIVGTYIINENHTLPVLSISLNPSDFKNIQSNPWNTELESNAYIELYEKGKSFSIPCGFKLFGGSTRGLSKKSFSIKFKKKYGSGSLKYQIFENRDYSEYNSLVIRSGSQDSESAFIRDILMTSLVEGKTNLTVQAYKSVILYINGIYWGVYNIREKVDDDFISNNYNVSKNSSNIFRIDNNVTTGSIKEYNSLLNYVSSHDMRTEESYNYVSEILNVDSYIDFWVAENWVTNNDIINTRFFSHPSINNGKLNMIFYDLDYAMWNYSIDYYKFSTDPSGMSDLNVSTSLLIAMMKNSKFKEEFKNRVCYQYKNIWNEENVINKIDEIYNLIKPEMERNQLRWNQTMEEWEKEIETLKEYASKRGTYFKSTTKSFFNMTDNEMKECFGE